jgi:hypothetical protein
MVKQQGIDVYVAPFGKIDQRYPEHPAPIGSVNTALNSKEVYIEAIDGERFVVVVDVGKDFDTRGSSRLETSYTLDKANPSAIRTYQNTHSDLKLSAPNVSGLEGRHTHTIRSKSTSTDDGHGVVSCSRPS